MNPGEVIRVKVTSTKGRGWYEYFRGEEYDVIVPSVKKPDRSDQFILADTPYNRTALVAVKTKLGRNRPEWIESMFRCWIERQDVTLCAVKSNKEAKQFLIKI